MTIRLIAALGVVCLTTTTVIAQKKKGPPRGVDINCHWHKNKACVHSKTMALPKDVGEFLERRKTMGTNVWQAATLVVHALMKRLDDKKAGGQMLVLMTTESNLRKNTRRGPKYKGWGFHPLRVEGLRRADRKPYCIRSFAAGTTHKTGYKLDPKNVQIRFRRQDSYSGSIKNGRYRVFVCSSGADTCKALWMTRNPKGIWKADQWGFIIGGCRKPIKRHEAVDDL